MATPGVFIIRKFQYRGNDEEWGNGYHFQGDAPSAPADWRSLVDALVALESPMLLDTVSTVRALCYPDYSPHHDSVYTYDLTHFAGAVPGGLDHTDGPDCPGDTAFWCRWGTGRVNSQGKPIYLRKYFHGCLTNGPPNQDELLTGQRTLAQTYAAAVRDSTGDWPGMAQPNGDPTDETYLTSTYLTTRTLKRRGRRPT
jgi:hypothetical protein